MSSIGSPSPFFFGGKKAAYEIDRGLRFNDGDSPLLYRTPSSSSNRKKWTYSCWVKRSNIDSYQGLLAVGTTDGGEDFFGFHSDNKLYFRFASSSDLKTKAVFRDSTAWLHIVVVADTEQSQSSATASDSRLRFYVNGQQITSFDQSNMPSQNDDFRINDTEQHYIGEYPRINSHLDGYLAEVNFLDGYALDASYFGETDVDTGQWNPKKYTGGYGSNGFYLNFSDNSGTSATTLGKDSSGNTNNFTPSNFATNDAVKDSPTNNFCTLNPLQKNPNGVYSEGNLRLEPGSGYNSTIGNMGVSSGKWYFEARCNGIAGGAGQERWIFGIHETTGQDFSDATWWYSSSYTISNYGYVYGVQDGDKKVTNETQSSFTSGLAVGNVVGFRLDLDNNELSVSVDGVDKGKLFDIQGGVVNGVLRVYAPAGNFNQSGTSVTLNCGQDSTFHGQESSGGNADANGIGDFAYAVPSGYKAICSATLPDPTIKLPNKHFDTITYDGNYNNQSITGLQFQPDWLWIKNRDRTSNHGVYDSVRGVDKALYASESDAEQTPSPSNNALLSFDANGWSMGNNSNSPAPDINYQYEDYVGWCWNGGEAPNLTYKVVVVSDSGNKYRFRNSADNATFAQSAVVLNLEEGGTYVFDWSDSTAQSHPIRFSTTADGTHGGGTEYTTGVVKDDSNYKTTITIGASAPTLYYYCQYHSGMGGQLNTNSTKGSTNFDGSVLSHGEVPVARANPIAGLSIVSYKGASGTYEIGHGLGATPQIIITKERSASDAWWTHTTAVDGTLDYVALSTNTQSSPSDAYSIGLPTSLTFQDDDDFTANTVTAIAYCISSVEGYSKVGSYTGNGSTDGVFVYLGFRPAFVIQKRMDSAGHWYIFDYKRSGFNVDNDMLISDLTYSEYDGTTYPRLDFCANGFKLRASDAVHNASGGKFLYVAFAKSPFKNARAR